MTPEVAPDPSQAERLVSRVDLEGRVDSFLLNRMDLNRSEFVVREVTPRLTWNRLDLAIKLFYLEQSEVGRSAFAEELYDAHIHAFSLGDFREPGNEAKMDAASFRTAFQDILAGLRVTGFDPGKSLIPAATDGSFINGGHRAACALFLGHKVHVVETGLPPVRYDYRFFQSRGMDEDLVEAAMMRYVERNARARVALLWPGSGTPAEVEKHLGPLACRKQVRLSAKGVANLLSSLDDGSDRPNAEFSRRSSTGSKPLLYVFQPDEPDHELTLRTRLEDLAEKNNHALQLPASREQGLELARVLLNERSIGYLNSATPDRSPVTARMARMFRDTLGRAGVPRGDAILGPGMVLAAFGAREATTVDVILPTAVTVDDPAIPVTPLPSPHDIRDILQDPRRHFYAWGLKFLSVTEALRVQERNPILAEDDQRQLAALLPRAQPRHPARTLLANVRVHYSRVRRSTIRTIINLGLRKQATVLYRTLRGGR